MLKKNFMTKNLYTQAVAKKIFEKINSDKKIYRKINRRDTIFALLSLLVRNRGNSPYYRK